MKISELDHAVLEGLAGQSENYLCHPASACLSVYGADEGEIEESLIRLQELELAQLVTIEIEVHHPEDDEPEIVGSETGWEITDKGRKEAKKGGK